MPFPRAFLPSARRAGCALVVFLLGARLSSHAALLVYEGFNGYTGAAFTTSTTPNTNTFGLNTGVAYGGTTVTGVGIVGTSLLFSSNFLTSGGSVRIASGTTVAAATLAIGSTPYTGTLFSSYLVNFTGARGGLVGDGALIRIADSVGTSAERLESMADVRGSGTTNNSPNIGAGYDGGTNGSTVGDATLAAGTTYLMIARFTNVGAALAIGQGVATVYALTAAQYDAFVAAGATEAYLDAAATGSDPLNISAKAVDNNAAANTFGFATGNFSHFLSVNDNTGFDEIRYGSTLADVVPTPEPGSALLAVCGGVALLARRGRR